MNKAVFTKLTFKAIIICLLSLIFIGASAQNSVCIDLEEKWETATGERKEILNDKNCEPPFYSTKPACTDNDKFRLQNLLDQIELLEADIKRSKCPSPPKRR